MSDRPLKFRCWSRETKRMYWFDVMWGAKAYPGDGWIGMVPWGDELERRGFYHDNKVLNAPDDCEFMQFTGLHDCQGREVWEGDYLMNETGLIFFVEWDQENLEFKALGKDERLFRLWPSRWASCRVVGNVWQGVSK